MYKFKEIRIHRSIACGLGAGFASAEPFTGFICAAVWLIGEVVSFVIFEHEEDETVK